MLEDEDVPEASAKVDNALRVWQYEASWVQLASQDEMQ